MINLVDNANILIFNFDINEDILLLEYEKIKHKEKAYKDERGEVPFWKIAHGHFDYAKQLEEIFDIKSRPRFYNLKPNSHLPYHTDRETKCSINFILDSKNPAPVKFRHRWNKELEYEYHYKCALLNTQIEHSVKTEDESRLLFKLSIFDEDFETVKGKIKNVCK